VIAAVMPTYARADVAFERGEGVYIYSTDGRRFLDFGAGVAVVSLGHCHPHLVAALKKQAETLWHCSNLYRIPGQERLASRLVEHSFADSVFFNNSGAEAMECVIKMVRKFHDENGRPERYRVITFADAFHGRTLATIAAGRQEKHLKGFDPMVEGFDQVPFGNLNALRAAITKETAAVLIEPVQGEGGVNVASIDFLKAVRVTCDEFGLLLALDEVQCGMGRTGKLFAHEWAGIAPDIMGVAKGIGGGFPLGACLATERVARVMTAGSHGSTFGGNPLAMAVGNAVLDVILADGFLDRMQRIGQVLWTKLAALARKHPGVIAEVRGGGLMLGLKMVPENLGFVDRLIANGLLTVPAGNNVVRLVPPLIVEESHVEEAIAILDKTCRAVSDRAA
jgi:acetylornithine/N-succinyldiaminopimelate aminotransferase